jgi:hypothetical protein
MRYEPPLSDKERAELARIRAIRAAKNARREINDAHYWDGAVKTIVAIIVGGIVLLWPEAAFHRNPVQGHYTLTTTGWIVQIIWIIFLSVVVLGIWLLNKRGTKK